MPTTISWTEETWNPITGCTHAGSPACDHCYAKKMAIRLRSRFGYPENNPFEPGTFHQDQLDKPLTWNVPKRVFVTSMGDLCHPNVRFDHFKAVFDVIIKCELEKKGHIFQILTKRPHVMKDFMRQIEQYIADKNENSENPIPYPLPNVWLGVTAENQQCADIRIPVLLEVPAVIHFVSCEPLLSEINISTYLGNDLNKLNWVIVGGESGHKARKTDVSWIRSLRDQCLSTDVAFHFKQWGHYKFDLAANDYTHFKKAKDAGNIIDNQLWEQYPEYHTNR